MPALKHGCCCCCSLKTGVVIVAIYSLIFNLVVIFVAIYKVSFCGSSLAEAADHYFSVQDYERTGYYFCVTLFDIFHPDISTTLGCSGDCFTALIVALFSIGALCSISPLVSACQATTVRAKNKRAFVYPWITWCVLVSLCTIAAAILVLLKHNAPVWVVILSGLFIVGHHTWFGLLGFSFVQLLLEVQIEDDEIELVQNEFF